MFFARTSVKLRNLAANPQLAVVAVDDTGYSPGVPVYALMPGTATIGPPEPETPDRLARAYGQPHGFEGTLPAFNPVIMTVDRITGMGPIPGGELGGWRQQPGA